MRPVYLNVLAEPTSEWEHTHPQPACINSLKERSDIAAMLSTGCFYRKRAFDTLQRIGYPAPFIPGRTKHER